jgi:hypothetical protein
MRIGVYCSLIGLVLALFSACEKKEEKEEGERIAVYTVTSSGASRDTAEKLVKALPVDERILQKGDFIDGNGKIAFIDSQTHLAVPTKMLGKEDDDEDGQPVEAQALDLDALKNIKALDQNKAKETFTTALKEAQLLPARAEARTRNNTLMIVDNDGKVVAQTNINTRVEFDLKLGGYLLEGPGAQVSASFSPKGQVTQLKYATRDVSEGPKVRLVNADQAKQRCMESYRQSAPQGDYQKLEVNTQLYYFAPALNTKKVHTIIPYYQCSATAMVDNQKVSLLQRSVPAIDEEKFVPKITLKATAKGTTVNATADIKGGSGPYQIRWSSPSIGSKAGENKLEYQLARRAKEMQEVLSVDVIDSNGVFVQASQAIQFDQNNLPKMLDFPVAMVAGVRDYGTENSVFNQFGGLEQGFKDQMNDDSVVRRFSWRGLAAWEQDFKSPEDSNWIDNTDITFYVGHGNVGLFTFEDTAHDDSTLDNDDATGDWGDKDLEWLALYSCQVLGRGADGQEPFRNWKQEFDGLHLLLGFHTNAAVSNDFSGKFASDMVESNMTVAQAWFDAIDDHQPNDRVGIVMGVFRASDWAWNYSDHFHGKGSVGPDIRGSNIGLGWYVSGP